MLTCEYNHVRLCSAATEMDPGLDGTFRQQLNSDWKALGFAQPSLIGRNLGQLPGGNLVTLLDAPPDALNSPPEELPGSKVERDQHLIAGQNVPESVLAQIRRDPAWAVFEKAKQWLPIGDILAWREPQVRHHPITGRNDSRVPQIELCLLECCDSLAHFGVGQAG